MTKKNEQPSIKVEPRPTEGKRNGFLAEEKHLDRRGLLRLGTWGAIAVTAVAVAVLANESAIKLRRDEAAAVDLARQSQQIQALAKESQNQTRRLASAIDTLNNDRDRLFARVTVLEEGLDSVTGSIAKQDSPKAAAQPSASPAATSAVASSPTLASPSPQSAAENPIPAPWPTPGAAPVASEAAITPVPEKPVADAKPAEPPAAKMAAAQPSKPSGEPQQPGSGAPTSAQPMHATPPAPLKDAKSTVSPHGPMAQKPVAPAAAPPKAAAASAPLVVAAATPEEKEKNAPAPAQPAAGEIAVKRTQFGIDLGGANSVPALRALWRSLLKTPANAPLMALQPIIVIREAGNGLGMQLRLVAGPFDDAAAAAKMCAGLVERQRSCETTVYDGQRLALKPGDEPALANVESTRSTSAKIESARAEAEQPEFDKAEPEKSVPEKAARRAPLRRRIYAKKVTPEPQPPAPPTPPAAQEPPKPEPTTFSSLFGRHPAPPPAANGP